jgi:hypothetical protein
MAVPQQTTPFRALIAFDCHILGLYYSKGPDIFQKILNLDSSILHCLNLNPRHICIRSTRALFFVTSRLPRN